MGEAVDGRVESEVLDFALIERLYPRYSGPGPRYTSYPTVPAWSSDFETKNHVAALESLDLSAELSLYTHIPFCQSLCHFCACNRVITQNEELSERFLDAIEVELRTTVELLSDVPKVGQLHWGGGTPTHLTPPQLLRLFESITKHVELLPDAELGIEVDPRVTTVEQIDTLVACGFNRLSLGVQDTSRRTQEAIHRIQPFEQTLALTEAARARGVNGINYDLIYGLPHQTVESIDETLDDVLIARPDRIALYGYAHVTWVAKQQRGFERGDLPSPARRLAIFRQACERLVGSGYRWIGMDHFALPDDELSEALDGGTLRRNFMGYTTRAGTDVLAFGPSAISQLGNAFAQAEKTLPEWSEKVFADRLPTARGHWLTEDDRARSWVIGQVMCVGRVTAQDVLERFGESFFDDYVGCLDRLKPLADDGLIEMSSGFDLTVRSVGRVFLRNVAMAFDAYLDPAKEPAGRVFSETV